MPCNDDLGEYIAFPTYLPASKHTSCYLFGHLFPSPAVNQLFHLPSKMKSHIFSPLSLTNSYCNPDNNKDISSLEANLSLPRMQRLMQL